MSADLSPAMVELARALAVALAQIVPDAAPAAPAGPALLTTEEAGEFLSISPRTLESWRSRAPEVSPPFLRVAGDSIRYARADLERWIATQPRHGSPLPAPRKRRK